MSCPISASPLAEIVPTWAISSLEVIFLECLLEIRDDRINREIETAFEIHWVHARGHGLGAFLDDSMGEYSGRRGAITSQPGGLGRNFLDHLRAHILELVLELDLIGDGDAIFGNARPEGLIERDIASLGAERHADRAGKSVDAAQHFVARLD